MVGECFGGELGFWFYVLGWLIVSLLSLGGVPVLFALEWCGF